MANLDTEYYKAFCPIMLVHVQHGGVCLCPGIIYLFWKYYIQTTRKENMKMKNKPNHKTLLNAVHCWANNDWDFVLKFPNKSSTILNPNRLSTVLKCKKYWYYCYCFHLVLCHFFLPSSEVKTQKPFSVLTRKQWRYLPRDLAIAKDTKDVNWPPSTADRGS